MKHHLLAGLLLILAITLFSCETKDSTDLISPSSETNFVNIEWTNCVHGSHEYENATIQVFNSRSNWIYGKHPIIKENIGIKGFINVNLPPGTYWFNVFNTYSFSQNPISVMYTDEISFTIPETKGLDKDILIEFRANKVELTGYKIMKIEFYPDKTRILNEKISVRFFKFIPETKLLLLEKEMSPEELPILAQDLNWHQPMVRDGILTEIRSGTFFNDFGISAYNNLKNGWTLSNRLVFKSITVTDSLVVYGEWQYAKK